MLTRGLDLLALQLRVPAVETFRHWCRQGPASCLASLWGCVLGLARQAFTDYIIASCTLTSYCFLPPQASRSSHCDRVSVYQHTGYQPRLHTFRILHLTIQGGELEHSPFSPKGWARMLKSDPCNDILQDSQ